MTDGSTLQRCNTEPLSALGKVARDAFGGSRQHTAEHDLEILDGRAVRLARIVPRASLNVLVELLHRMDLQFQVWIDVDAGSFSGQPALLETSRATSLEFP